MRVLLAVLCLFLTSCTASQLNEKLSTPQDRSVAERFIAALQTGRLDTVKSVTDPKLFDQTVAMETSIQPGIPKSTAYKLVTVATNTTYLNGNVETLKALTYEFGAGKTWAAFQIVLKTGQGGPQVVGWHAAPYDHQPTSSGNFEFSGKGILNYLWLLAMAASTVTIFVALFLISRSKGINRRWLWALGSAVGLCQFTLNWTTSAWAVRPLGFFLMGSAAFKASPFDPWMLSFSLPVVAVIFLLRRKALMAGQQEASFD